MKIDADLVRREIASLLARYPELEDDEQFRADMIEAETTAHDLLRKIVRRIGETKASFEGIANYQKELAERHERLERRAEGLRSFVLKIMNEARLSRIELPEATLSVRAGVFKVVITDEAQLPEDCIRIRREPDKTAIKEKLSRDEPVPGAFLSNGEPSLTVRVK